MGSDIVLGLGGCLDYEITWDAAVMEDLVRLHGVRAEEVDPSVPVRSERDLVRSVLGFVRDGVGGERFVTSSDIVEAFAARFARRTTLGGTPVRAALAMSRIGVPSTVHLVSTDDQVRRLLPPDVTSLCSATRDTVDPHLIVQFPAGARVRAGDVDVRAPVPNRLIYVNDPPNRELLLSPALSARLATARVFLISGLNSMQDPVTVTERLHDLRDHMRSLPRHAVVVYEDGGFHVPELGAQVREGLLDLVDVFGMNEDELQGHLRRRLDLADPVATARALRDLHAVVPARTLVVHTRCWSLAYGPDPERFRDALELGVTLAGTRYVHGDGFTAPDHERVARAPRLEGGLAFARALESELAGQVCCVPARRLEADHPTTIGLGDTFVGGFLAALARVGEPVTGRAG